MNTKTQLRVSVVSVYLAPSCGFSFYCQELLTSHPNRHQYPFQMSIYNVPLSLECPVIFCNISHQCKRDLGMMAKPLCQQHSIDWGKWSDNCVSGNTHSLRIQGNPASEELGCLGTVHVKMFYSSQKRLQQTWHKSHENLILQGQGSANIKMGNCCTCKTNRWKLAFRDKLCKKEDIINKKAESTLYTSIYHFTK